MSLKIGRFLHTLRSSLLFIKKKKVKAYTTQKFANEFLQFLLRNLYSPVLFRFSQNDLICQLFQCKWIRNNLEYKKKTILQISMNK